MSLLAGMRLLIFSTLFSAGISSDIGSVRHVVLEVQGSGNLGQVRRPVSAEPMEITDAPGFAESEERALLDDQEDLEHELKHRNQLKLDREENKRQHVTKVVELLGDVSAADASEQSSSSLEYQLWQAALKYRTDSGLSNTGRNGDDCLAVLTKAKSILDYHVVVLTANKKPARNLPTMLLNLTIAISAAAVPPNPTKLTPAFLSNISAALSGVTLTEGLQAGFVWTSEDQYNFATLCLAQSGVVGHPEENAQIASSGSDLALYHGDLAVVAELSSPPPAPLQPKLPWNAMNNWATNLRTVGARSVSTVYYCYASSLNDPALAALKAALAHIQSQVACLNFTLTSLSGSGAGCQTLPSVLITADPGAGCWSHFGQAATPGQSQILNIGPGCESMGMVLHQLGHMLGLGHEVSRIDRDYFLSFAKGGATAAYSMFPVNNATIPVLAFANTSFDYLSIMMPSPFSFVEDDVNLTQGTPAFAPSYDPMRMVYFYMGQRMSLSAGDVYRLNELHGCPGPIATPVSPTTDLMENWNKGRGFVLSGECMDHPGNYRCSQWSRCWDSTDPAYSSFRVACQNTCLQCLQPPETVSRMAREFLKDVDWTNQSDVETVNVTAGGCFDQPITGITFLDGNPATCEQLIHYCNDPNMGAEVQSACTLSCGLCALQSVNYINSASMTETGTESETESETETETETETGCHDGLHSDKPQFLIQGVPQPCPDLISYCSGTPQSSLVIKKCPLTCGFCIGSPAPPPTTAMPAFQPHWDFNNFTMQQTNSSGMSQDCDRRRRFGFCASRRRRDNIISGSDVDPDTDR